MIRVIRTRQSEFVVQRLYSSAAAPDCKSSKSRSTSSHGCLFRPTESTRIPVHRKTIDARLFSAKTNASISNSELPRFQHLGQLSPGTLAALQRAGLDRLTEIQAKTLEPILSGNDVIARARTGTGKVRIRSTAGVGLRYFLHSFQSSLHVAVSSRFVRPWPF